MIHTFTIPNDFEKAFYTLWQNRIVKVRVVSVGYNDTKHTLIFRVENETGQSFAVDQEDLYESEVEVKVPTESPE